MSTAIRVLPPELASQIAAGEVIERPASVVKELLENAVDAGARRVDVEVRGGGAELIRVADDGRGIPAAELELACARHGTSKLRSVDDLFRIGTLGFRGEALPSIAAVSRFELLSRPADKPAGEWVAFEGGRPTGRGRRAHAGGTVVTVRDLFLNVPARRKYLRSPSAEGGAIASLLTTFALAYPEVALRLIADGQTVFSSPGTGDGLEAIGRVFGASAARQMLPVPPPDPDLPDDPEAPAVTGWVGAPALNRGSRAGMLLFVNRRPVTSRSLLFAITDAYHSLLPDGRFPVVVLNLTVPADEVDVNVHPAKAEVKFLRDRLVFATVQRAVRRALGERALVPVASRLPQPQPAAEPVYANRAIAWPSYPAPAPVAPSAPIEPVEHQFGDDPAAPVCSAGGKRLPPLRVLGQASNLFLIAEGPDGVYLIDQHAAHERITYDRLVRERRDGHVSAQLLLDPVAVELSPRALAGVDERIERYRAWGFDVERFGHDAVLVRSVPAALRARDVRLAVAEIVEETADDAAPVDWEERLLVSLACRGSVRAGQPLSPVEQRELIARLEQTELPHTCPHGRPVMVLLTQAQLERQFGRH